MQDASPVSIVPTANVHHLMKVIHSSDASLSDAELTQTAQVTVPAWTRIVSILVSTTTHVHQMLSVCQLTMQQLAAAHQSCQEETHPRSVRELTSPFHHLNAFKIAIVPVDLPASRRHV